MTRAHVISFDADATDANAGDTLTYSATNLPDGISINSSTGVVSGTLCRDRAGSHAVVLTVSDGTLTDTDSFTWTVIEPNVAPVFSTDVRGSLRRRGRLVIGFDADATDANAGDTLTYSATNLPDGISINVATGVVSGTLSATSAGRPRGRADRQRRHAHRHRLASPGRSTEPQRGTGVLAPSSATARTTRATVVSFDANATDANPGDTLTYSATNLPDGISINAEHRRRLGHPQCHQLRQLRGRADRQRRHAHRHRLASPGPSPSRNVAPVFCTEFTDRTRCRRRRHQLRRQRHPMPTPVTR